jgi:hypothetical protein
MQCLISSRFRYERLKQGGQLVDVDTSTDVVALPANVTHVRYPDGTVERIGFSASPFGAWFLSPPLRCPATDNPRLPCTPRGTTRSTTWYSER